MTETEIIYALKELFNDQIKLNSVVSRFIYHQTIWSGIQDENLFNRIVQKNKNDVDKWNITNICLIASEGENTAESANFVYPNNSDNNIGDEINSVIKKITSDTPLSSYFPIADAIIGSINNSSWQEFSNLMPEISRPEIVSCWGTIISIVLENIEDKNGILSTFINSGRGNFRLVLLAFLLAANPDLASQFEIFLSKEITHVRIEDLIALLQEIQQFGHPVLPEYIATKILVYCPMNNSDLGLESDSSITQIMERIHLLKNYGLLQRFIPTSHESELVIQQLEKYIELLKEKIQHIFIDPALTINDYPDFSKEYIGMVDNERVHDELEKNIIFTKELAKNDRTNAIQYARKIADSLGKNENILEEIYHKEKGFSINPIDLANFFLELDLVQEAKIIAEKLIQEIPMDISLLQFAAKLNHDHGDHFSAIHAYSRLAAILELERTEKLCFAESLEYHGQWADASKIRLEINLTGLNDLRELVISLFSADRFDLLEDILLHDQFGFEGTELHKVICGWMDLRKGKNAIAEAVFEEMSESMLSDGRAACLVADYFQLKNDSGKAILVLEKFSNHNHDSSFELERIKTISSLHGASGAKQKLYELAGNISGLKLREIEEYMKLLIDAGELDFAMKIIQQLSNTWLLSPVLAAQKGRLLLEKKSFSQAESIFTQLIQREKIESEWIIDICLSILRCPRNLFPFRISRDRLLEARKILLEHDGNATDDFFLEILKAELIQEDPIKEYKKILSNAQYTFHDEKWRIFAAMGINFFYRSEYDKAIIHLMDALSAVQNHPDILYYIISSFNKLQLWEEAINLIDPYIDNADLPLIFFWNLHDQLKENIEWRKFIEEKYSIYPENPVIRLLYAAIMVAYSEKENGLQVIDHLIIEDTHNLPRQLIYAQILITAGELTRSKRIIEIILSNDAIKAPEVDLSCAFLLHQIGEYEKEIRLLDQVSINNEQLIIYASFLKAENGKYDEAKRGVESVVFHNESNFDTFNQDNILVKKPVLWEKLNHNPVMVYILGSHIAQANNDLEGSLMYIEKGLEVFPHNTQLIIMAVEKTNLLGKDDAKKKWIKALENRTSQNPELNAICVLGEMALVAGEEVLAANYLSQVLKINEEHSLRVKALQTRILRRNGNYQEANALIHQIKNELDLGELSGAEEVDGKFITRHLSVMWLIQTAYEMGDLRFCLDLCHREIEENGINLQNEKIFLLTLTKCLVRNEVYKEFHIEHHLHTIEDQDLDHFNKIKTRNINEESDDHQLKDWIKICDAVISAKISDFGKIKNCQPQVDFASIIVKAEYLLNGLEAAEIKLSALDSNHMAGLQLAGLIKELKPQKALSLVKSVITNSSSDPLNLAALAFTLKHNDQINDAYAAICLALQAWPEEYKWEIFAAELSRASGDIKGALEHYDKSNRLFPNIDSEEFISHILISNKNPRAIQLLEEKIKEDPADLEILIKIGELYIENNQLRKAATNLERVIQMDPDNLNAHIMMSSISIAMNNLQKAEYYLEYALKLEGNHPDALVIKSDIMQKKYGYLHAQNFLDDLIDNKSVGHEKIILKKSQLITCEAGQKAAINYLSSLDQKNLTIEILLEKSRLHMEINELDLAEQSANQAFLLGNSPKAFAILGDVAEIKGDLDRAIDFYIKAIKHDPLEKDYYIKLSKTYEKRRDYHQSKEILLNGLRTIPEDFDLLLASAQFFHRQGLQESAIDAVTRALRIKPDQKEANRLFCLLQPDIIHKQVVQENVT